MVYIILVAYIKLMNTDENEPIVFSECVLSTAYTIDSEAEFLIKTIHALQNEKYEMIKSQDKYAHIDFILLNKNNLCSVLIEHKRKSISGLEYETFFIGYKKLIALDTFYNSPVYLVFECLDNTYWCEYDSSFLKRPIHLIKGGKLIEIRKSECGRGFPQLISQLKNSLNM